jgi:hypothetical protein
MPTIYRFITEDDTSQFCHRISEALSKGWTLQGDPAMSFDAARGVMRCGQAVTKEVATEYHPEMKLGQQ